MSPICLETYFAVGFRSIDNAAGPIPIYGLSGNTVLLTAQIQNTAPGVSSVALSMGDRPGRPLASITNAEAGSLRGVIQDKFDQIYGEFTNTGHLDSMAYSLIKDRVEVMRMRTDQPSGRVVLVTPPDDNTELASASRLHAPNNLPSQEDYMAITVAAHEDPILIILCILGAMALSH